MTANGTVQNRLILMHYRKTVGLRPKDLIGITKFKEGVIMAMFKKIVKNFGPEWGAAVMSTAAICITMNLLQKLQDIFFLN